MECYDCNKPAKIILGNANTQDIYIFIPLCKEHAKLRSYSSKGIYQEYSIKDGDIYEEIFEKTDIQQNQNKDEESQSNS